MINSCTKNTSNQEMVLYLLPSWFWWIKDCYTIEKQNYINKRYKTMCWSMFWYWGCRLMRRSGIWNRNIPTNSKLDVRFPGNEQIITWKQTTGKGGADGKKEVEKQKCQWCCSLNYFIAWQSKHIWPYVGWRKKHSEESKLTSNIQWSM